MIKLTEANFNEEVLQSKLPVIVDFWGPKCAECLELMPRLEELEKKYAGRVKFSGLNVVDEKKTAIKQKVLGTPTILLYKDGIKEASLIKHIDLNELEMKIQKLL